jgi:hypothetical protein
MKKQSSRRFRRLPASPFLAAVAAACLAALPARADDLLDAVLWDGPSAFPSKSAPAAPAPAAPSVPARLPPAPQPAAIPAPAPAAPEPASTSVEAQLRHEIEEMRARADRLEAALGPAAPPDSASPPSNRAHWLERARLSLLGTDDSQGYACSGEFAFSVAETPFDVAIRGYWLDDAPAIKSGYSSSSRWFTLDARKRVRGAAVWGLWHPWRDAVVSPHAGVGVGAEYATGHRSYREYTDRGHDSESSWDEDLEDDGPTLAGRVGATLTYKRLTLKGEIILTSGTRTFLAEAGLRLWNHLVLNGILERFDVDLSDSVDVFGGGFTILF